MDKARAFEVLGLQEGVSHDDIVKRYNMLLLKMKGKNDEESLKILDDITDAYNLLMGYEYVTPETQQKKKRLISLEPVYKLLKIDPQKADNFLEYHKWHIILSIVLLIFSFSMVRSCINRVPSDLNIDFFGDIYCSEEDQIALRESILESMPDAKEVNIQFLVLNDRVDPQIQVAIMQKIFVEMAAGDVDVLILDRRQYKRYAEQGAFTPLEDILEKLGATFEENKDLVISIVEKDLEGNIVKKGLPHLYGIDVSESRFLKKSGVKGKEMVAAIRLNCKHYENAVNFLKMLIRK